VRKGGALVQSSQVYEMHTKRLMAFEKRGQNDITQPLLPLYSSSAISRQIALARGKVNSSNMRHHFQSLKLCPSTLISQSHLLIIRRLFLPPIRTFWNLHHCTLAPDMRHSTRNPLFSHHLLRQSHETAPLQTQRLLPISSMH
jgi:hypothetical protein